MGSGGTAPPFLTSVLDGGEWSASRPGCFAPGERVPGTHWTGGWVKLRANLNAVEWRQVSCPCRESIPSRTAHSPSIYRLSYSGSCHTKFPPIFGNCVCVDYVSLLVLVFMSLWPATFHPLFTNAWIARFSSCVRVHVTVRVRTPLCRLWLFIEMP
jgi:hypothetical protein